MTQPRKLSATALSCYLESPKAYFWRYIQGVETAIQSVGTYDHDKICGSVWADFVDRFYKRVPEAENTGLTLASWDEQTHGWVPDKFKDPRTRALESWATTYYQEFSPEDGVRNGSEKHLENDKFMGYLDGLSHDLVVHEVKSTSRSKQIVEQLWKAQNSLQVKLYCVLAQATGIRIEFAWKDTPYGIYRSEIKPVTPNDLQRWETELNTLADCITSLRDDPAHYPCHPDGCCLVTKNIVSMCQYQTLCELGLTDETSIAYKPKGHR